MTSAYPPLAITPNWARLNDTIIGVVDYVPDGKLNWSPSPELYNFRGILLHVSLARHNWLTNFVKDGASSPDFFSTPNPKGKIVEHLRSSWARLERFLSDPENLARTYTGAYFDKEQSFDGHWVAFHLLEHDAHHRADLFHYLHILGVAHPEVETP